MSDIRHRTMGKYPLSIATSIALESITGHPEPTNGKQTHNSLGGYGEFWINVKTLFRNIAGSLQPNTPKPKNDEFVITVLNEIKAIRDIVQRNSQAKVIFYISNYDRLDSIYRHVELRRDTTPKQKDYTKTMQDVLQQVIRKIPKDNNYFLLFNHDLRPKTQVRTLMLSHITYDLTFADNFIYLDLLESHTGLVKSKHLWYTKYFQGNTLPPFPLTKYLLPVFGDRETFRPLNIKAKSDVLKLIEDCKWHALTTDAKMKHDIKKLNNKFLVETIQSFY